MEAKYTFQHIPERKFCALEDPKLNEWLAKWSMKGRLTMQSYSFNEPFEPYQKSDFTLAFMQSPMVASTLQSVSDDNEWKPIGVTATSVRVDPVFCTVTSMNIFDRLYSSGVLHESGTIRKCLDQCYNDILVCDELRKMFLTCDSDYYNLFTREEHNEFIVLLLKHLSLGGKWCQFEDDIKPYMDATKLIYKDLISVVKHSEREEVQVSSVVLKICAYNEHSPYFPRNPDHPQNFAYLAVDSQKRIVKTFYHEFGGNLEA